MNCPTCGHSGAELLEIASLSNGSRRRRYSCRGCKHRWTTWTGDSPRQSQVPLSDDMLRLILTRLDLNDKEMAQQIGRSRESVRQIRAGIAHAGRCPELPRRVHHADDVTCLSCKHWRGCCGFGFPDPVEEGIGFAKDCLLHAV